MLPPDGEIAANAAPPEAPEFRSLPPEFAAPPVGGAVDPRTEYTPPPPEFPRGLTTSEEPPRKKRRVWQKLIAAALVGTMGFVLYGAAPESPAPEKSTAPPESGPVETEPTAPVEDGSLPAIDIGYALTDGTTIYYSYFVNVPGNGEPEEERYWPVTVHAEAEDGDGRKTAAEDDVWEFARVSEFAYEMDAAGLTGDLTLTITGDGELDGEAYTVRASAPIEPMPQGEALAFLWITDDGTADFKALVSTSEDDPHEYDLEPLMLWAEAFDADHQRIGGFWSLEDLSELTDESFVESGNREYVFHRMDKIGEPPERAKYCSFRVYLRDRSNGYIYQLESNVCPLPAKSWPLENEIIELTVYNDTLAPDYANSILVQTQINAADFTEYELPLYNVPAGYRATGYVVFYGNPLDNGYDKYDDYGGLVNDPPAISETEEFIEPPAELLISEGMFAFPTNGLTLTKAMVERVPVASDGVRYVNVHATWAPVDESNSHFTVELDDGQGSVTTYPVAHPLASEGYFFTCTFPQPVPPIGYYFDGWYDEEGRRVDFLLDYYSFTPYLYDENGAFIGYDWNAAKTPLRLIAHWASYG